MRILRISKYLVFATACVIKLWSQENYVLFSGTVRAKIVKAEGDHTAYGGPRKKVVLAWGFAHKRPVR